jgi:hypothetical protein
MHMFLKMEVNAHYAHPLKGGNKYNYNPTQVLLRVMLSFKGMNEEVMGRKLVSFGTNGHFVFTNGCNGITTQIKHDVASSTQ